MTSRPPGGWGAICQNLTHKRFFRVWSTHKRKTAKSGAAGAPLLYYVRSQPAERVWTLQCILKRPCKTKTSRSGERPDQNPVPGQALTTRTGLLPNRKLTSVSRPFALLHIVHPSSTQISGIEYGDLIVKSGMDCAFSQTKIY